MNIYIVFTLALIAGCDACGTAMYKRSHGNRDIYDRLHFINFI